MTKEEYVLENIGLGMKYWRNNFSSVFEHDEAYAISYMAMLKAFENWDKDKGKFSTYSYFWIKKYFHDEYKKLNTIEYEDITMLDEEDHEALMYNENYDDKVDVEIIQKYLLENGLSKEDWNIYYDKHYSGLTNSELTQKYSIKGIRYRLAKISEIIQENLKNF